ncbi:MAG: hypothetical protein M5U12_25450 [Verrucomicrobia bacterium]|nr:hypothetical protein [Verrucomicrobiota bacterium]
MEDLSGEEHTSYDERGRVEAVIKRIPDPLGQSLLTSAPTLVSYRTAFAYDSLDRLVRLEYPDADQLRYEYNDRSLLQRIPGGPSGSVISNIVYRPSGQNGQIDYGNGVRTTYDYDSRLRLRDLHTLAPTGGEGQGEGADLIHFAYDFDGVSNIKTIADLRPGSAVPEGDPRRNTQLFQYDDLYRLTRAQYSFGLPGGASRNDGEINYRYDRIGNMLAQTSTLTNHVEKGLPVADLGEMDSGGTLGRWNRTGRAANDPPGPHALTAIRHPSLATRQYPYDANGNMTNIDGLACTWDFKDRLVAVENGEMRAIYNYDYTDRRIIKDVAYKPGSADATNDDSRITTLYINKYFEVREHDAPTKYVWNGNTRVARVTGSLNTNVRVQRLRVYLGWNLCSLAVSSPSPLWGEGRGEVLSAAFHWNPATLGWDEVMPTATLPAGAVLWLQAITNATLAITGTYSDPTSRTVGPTGDFLPSAGLEAWDLRSAISDLLSPAVWFYDSFSTRWLSRLPPPLELQSDLPSFIAPGQAVFVRADAPAQLEVPDSALRIRYYHQDHLGSSSCLSDSVGYRVYESALYPFGSPRNESASRVENEPYGFGQKERDFESKLNYVEARFLTAPLGRFLRVDPLASSLRPGWFLNPQRWNLYAYCHNNPVNFADPSGEVANFIIGAVSGALLNAGSEILDQYIQHAGKGGPFQVNWTKVGVSAGTGAAVGAATSGASAIKVGGTLVRLGVRAGLEAIGGAAESAGQQMLDKDGAGKPLNRSEMIANAIQGASTSILGEAASDALKGFLNRKILRNAHLNVLDKGLALDSKAAVKHYKFMTRAFRSTVERAGEEIGEATSLGLDALRSLATNGVSGESGDAKGNQTSAGSVPEVIDIVIEARPEDFKGRR